MRTRVEREPAEATSTHAPDPSDRVVPLPSIHARGIDAGSWKFLTARRRAS